MNGLIHSLGYRNKVVYRSSVSARSEQLHRNPWEFDCSEVVSRVVTRGNLIASVSKMFCLRNFETRRQNSTVGLFSIHLGPGVSLMLIGPTERAGRGDYEASSLGPSKSPSRTFLETRQFHDEQMNSGHMGGNIIKAE